MKRSASIAVLALAAALWFMPDANAQNSVRCESVDGRYQTCPVDTRGGVTLSRQLSSHGCWQGDTWGFDRNRIWVTNGCRAEFNVGRAESSSGNSNALAAAAIVALVGAAAIAAKKHHDRDDDRNDDDRYDGNTFTCASNDNRYVTCRMPVRGHVEVRRQLSKSQCRYGQSWGTTYDSVWVDDGCRAEFIVYR